MSHSKILILLQLLLLVGFARAQDIEYSRFQTRKVNNDYILDYSDKLLIKIYGITKSNLIAHADDLTGRKIEYKPNEDFNVGFGFGFKSFGLDLAFNILNSNKDSDVFGNTDRFDIQANLYLRKFVVDFNIQKYKGYYGFNPQDYKADFDPENPLYPIRPDIKTVNVSISSLYVFKHDKFSFRSVFTYNERQIKGTGSFLAGPYFAHFRMDADSTIVPQEVRSVFNPNTDFRGTRHITFGISGGYAHNFVILKRFFFSAAFVLGLGPEIIHTPKIDGKPSMTQTKVGGRLAIRTALGYNSEKFFIGLNAVADVAGGDDKQTVLERSISNFKLSVGKRFDPPKFLLKKKK